MTRAIFLSDIHLGPDEHDKIESLRSFFGDVLDKGSRLYLLGDIFEYWVNPKQGHEGAYAEFVALLAKEAARGVSVGFVPGNRDYLIDKRFERRSKCKVLGQEVLVEMDGTKVHLTHGDVLFSRNPKHGAYRRLMNFRMLKATIRSIPLRVGKMIGRGFRKMSQTEGRGWTERELLERTWPVFEQGADLFVCGHLHQPQKITFTHMGKSKALVVLGDWDHTYVYGEFEAGEIALRMYKKCAEIS